jgi:SAM-dependent methyltransferase
VGRTEYAIPASSVNEQRRRKNWLPKAICAIGENLPLRSSQFDVEICMLSSFFYAENKKELEDSLREALRVLKSDGKLFIYPYLPLAVSKDISVMNQWDINGSTDALTQDFFRILEAVKKSGEMNYVIKYPKNPPIDEDFSEAGYIEIVKK